MGSSPDISIVLPCRNEAAALPHCLSEIARVLRETDLTGEIIVSDSSIDESPEIARRYGARLIKHNRIGYGRAYLEALPAVRGRYIFCADADATYDFSEIPRFVAALAAGSDFVIGNRLNSTMESGAMPWLHRYVGNPLLSWLTRKLFGVPLRDVHCGMRAFHRSFLGRVSLQAGGMEFATEMIIAASGLQLRFTELPITYRRRYGISKLRPISDGWRHVRLMLRHASPAPAVTLPNLVLLGGVIALLHLIIQLSQS